MNQTMIIQAGGLIEQIRLRWHFFWTERQLRRRDVSGLSETQRMNRSLLIDHLRAYGQRGVFPINTRYAHKTPIFVDDEGRRCAVADLMAASGNMKIVDTVSAQANTAYVPDMKFPQLDQWAEEHGFTCAELAKIQPDYSVYLFPVTINTTLMWAGLFAVIAGFANRRHPWQVRRAGRVITALAGLLAGVGLFMSSYGLTRDLYPVSTYTPSPTCELCRSHLGIGHPDAVFCNPLPSDLQCPSGALPSSEVEGNVGSIVKLNFLFPLVDSSPHDIPRRYFYPKEPGAGFPFPPAVPPVQDAPGQTYEGTMTEYDGNLIWVLILAGYVIGTGLMLYGAFRLIREARQALHGRGLPAAS